MRVVHWGTFQAIVFMSTPIMVGFAYNGWFGAIIGAFVSFLLFIAILKHARRH